MQDNTSSVPNCQQNNAELAQPTARDVAGKFWPKKSQAKLLADSFFRLYVRTHSKFYADRADNVSHCSDNMRFTAPVDPSQGSPRVEHGSYCRTRLCPICDWLRSLQFGGQLTMILNKAQDEHPEWRLIFLTLTMRNVDGPELPQAIDDLNQGFARFLHNYRKRLKSVLGGFRTLEVTVNQDTCQYHPHLHCVVVVDEDYFKNNYISQAELQTMWQSSMRLDYEPIVHIRAVSDKKTSAQFFSSAVEEVAKYATKSADYLVPDLDETDRRVCDLAHSLHGRRLYTMWGIVRQLHKELHLPDAEKLTDTGHSDGVYVRDDVQRYLVHMRYVGGEYKIMKVSNETHTHEEWCAIGRAERANCVPKKSVVYPEYQKSNFRAIVEKAKKKKQKRPAVG